MSEQDIEFLYHALRLMFEGSDADKRLYLARMAIRFPKLKELSEKYPRPGRVKNLHRTKNDTHFTMHSEN